MLALIQRVTHANVVVDKNPIAEIQHGILALCGFEKEDTLVLARVLIERILQYRVFSDEQQKMNLSLTDINGELLIVPQFTLAADTKSGRRPSFSKAMPPKDSEMLFNDLKCALQNDYPKIQFGQFGADMKVSLCNDGPVTFLLRN